MVENKIVTEEHHRRPESLGGTDKRTNISFVPPSLHRCWHTLFGNMNAIQICNVINTYDKPAGVTVICKFINGLEVEKMGKHESKKNTKRSRAWRKLFKDMDFTEALEYINNTWLDPAYHLYLIVP